MLSLALAQIRNMENIRENFLNHIQFVKEAASYGCNFILFPELSLSGYMQEEVKEKMQLIKKEDMSIFKRLAEENKISISIGLPLEKEDGIFICQKIFCKDGSIKCYCKRFLHPGEEKYYKSSDDSDWTITENSIRIANAICYDIENERPHRLCNKKIRPRHICGKHLLLQGRNFQRHKNSFKNRTRKAGKCGNGKLRWQVLEDGLRRK